MPHPIEGQVVLLAGAKASVPLHRVKPLLERTASHLEAVDLDQYERVYTDDERAVYLADEDFWTRHGDEIGFMEREYDAVRRAHEQQLLRIGSREGRRDEFETALEIRTAVVVDVDR